MSDPQAFKLQPLASELLYWSSLTTKLLVAFVENNTPLNFNDTNEMPLRKNINKKKLETNHSAAQVNSDPKVLAYLNEYADLYAMQKKYSELQKECNSLRVKLIRAQSDIDRYRSRCVVFKSANQQICSILKIVLRTSGYHPSFIDQFFKQLKRMQTPQNIKLSMKCKHNRQLTIKSLMSVLSRLNQDRECSNNFSSDDSSSCSECEVFKDVISPSRCSSAHEVAQLLATCSNVKTKMKEQRESNNDLDADRRPTCLNVNDYLEFIDHYSRCKDASEISQSTLDNRQHEIHNHHVDDFNDFCCDDTLENDQCRKSDYESRGEYPNIKTIAPDYKEFEMSMDLAQDRLDMAQSKSHDLTQGNISGQFSVGYTQQPSSLFSPIKPSSFREESSCRQQSYFSSKQSNNKTSFSSSSISSSKKSSNQPDNVFSQKRSHVFNQQNSGSGCNDDICSISKTSQKILNHSESLGQVSNTSLNLNPSRYYSSGSTHSLTHNEPSTVSTNVLLTSQSISNVNKSAQNNFSSVSTQKSSSTSSLSQRRLMGLNYKKTEFHSALSLQDHTGFGYLNQPSGSSVMQSDISSQNSMNTLKRNRIKVTKRSDMNIQRAHTFDANALNTNTSPLKTQVGRRINTMNSKNNHKDDSTGSESKEEAVFHVDEDFACHTSEVGHINPFLSNSLDRGTSFILNRQSFNDSRGSELPNQSMKFMMDDFNEKYKLENSSSFEHHVAGETLTTEVVQSLSNDVISNHLGSSQDMSGSLYTISSKDNTSITKQTKRPEVVPLLSLDTVGYGTWLSGKQTHGETYQN